MMRSTPLNLNASRLKCCCPAHLALRLPCWLPRQLRILLTSPDYSCCFRAARPPASTFLVRCCSVVKVAQVGSYNLPTLQLIVKQV